MSILGQLLLRVGCISADQLRTALSVSSRADERLAQALVDLGYVTEDVLADTVADIQGTHRVELSEIKIDQSLMTAIPQVLLHKYLAIPLWRNQGCIILAMVDPTALLVVNEIERLLGCKVSIVVATISEIKRLLRSVAQPVSLATVVIDSVVAADGLVVAMVDKLLVCAIRERASDIHIEPQEHWSRIRFRVDGILSEVFSVPEQFQGALVSRIKLLAGIDITEKRVPQDGGIKWSHLEYEIDIRVSTLPTLFGEKLVLRLLNQEQVPTDLQQLGFLAVNAERYRRLYVQGWGMILITGSTGSGKTTTLYATLAELNIKSRNITTIEDPIEYHVPGISQVRVNTKAGVSFAQGLRAILRQDPDVVMVGEIRDNETMAITIRAALTGHLVLSTLHTNDAVGAIIRLLDMGAEAFLLADSLLGVVAQRLVRKICRNCAEEVIVDPGSWEQVYLGLDRGEKLILYQGRGCTECGYSGYKGRIALVEVLPISIALKALIHHRASREELIACASKEGMIRLHQDGISKVLSGVTTLNELRRIIGDSVGNEL